MNIQDLIDVNNLWVNIYPYLVKQILEIYPNREGRVLELGPFAGGISEHLAKECPAMDITIADEREEMLEWFKKELGGSEETKTIKIARTGLNKLEFDSQSFDLVIIRGAFFFLADNPHLLSEIHRVLKPEGVAFVGGGYGKDAPQEQIDAIASESRILNDRLGRKWHGIDTLAQLVEKAGLKSNTRIWEEGGVWLVISA
jgi:SAM-dependent methyltransferase